MCVCLCTHVYLSLRCLTQLYLFLYAWDQWVHKGEAKRVNIVTSVVWIQWGGGSLVTIQWEAVYASLERGERGSLGGKWLFLKNCYDRRKEAKYFHWQQRFCWFLVKMQKPPTFVSPTTIANTGQTNKIKKFSQRRQNILLDFNKVVVCYLTFHLSDDFVLVYGLNAEIGKSRRRCDVLCGFGKNCGRAQPPPLIYA